MKIFFSCLLIMICIFCQSSFAGSKDRAKQDAQNSQQKMAQLQQILMRATQSKNAPGSTESRSSGLNEKFGEAINKGGSGVESKGAQAISPDNAINSGADSARYQNSYNQGLNVAKSQLGGNSNVPQVKSNPYNEAFTGVINQMLPMSPEQIAKLRSIFTKSQSAAATPPGIPPKPTSTSIVVNLSPQATPPVIRLSAGYITSLVFVDTTGQPWPIKAYSIGDPSAFNIQWDRKGNTLLIQSSTYYKQSNLAVMLSDLNTPVMLSLIPGQGAIDYRVDLHIPGVGPNAVFSQVGMPEIANPMLLDVLSGIPPSGSKELKVKGGSGQAWVLNNRLYLRTNNNLNVISPAWQATMRSADGTNAYQLPLSPVVLATQNGVDKIITLRVEGD